MDGSAVRVTVTDSKSDGAERPGVRFLSRPPRFAMKQKRKKLTPEQKAQRKKEKAISKEIRKITGFSRIGRNNV